MRQVTEVDQLTIKANGQLEVRTKTEFIEGDEVITARYHRHVLHPGASLTDEAEVTQAVAWLIHTPEVVALFKSTQPQGALGG